MINSNQETINVQQELLEVETLIHKAFAENEIDEATFEDLLYDIKLIQLTQYQDEMRIKLQQNPASVIKMQNIKKITSPSTKVKSDI